MPRKSDEKKWHLSLSVQREIWDRLLRAALPIQVASGDFDLVQTMREAVESLDVKGRVRQVLQDRPVPEVVRRAQERAIALWRERRGQVHELVDEMIKVSGRWRVEITAEGSRFQYGPQEFGLQAQVLLSVEGQAQLLRNRTSFPFRIEKRAAASLQLVDIHYDRERGELVGELGDPLVDLGENPLLELVGRAAELALEKQLADLNPVRILSREQVESFIPTGSAPFQLEMQVEDLALEVDGEEVSLKLRFGFDQKALEDRGEEGSGG